MCPSNSLLNVGPQEVKSALHRDISDPKLSTAQLKPSRAWWCMPVILALQRQRGRKTTRLRPCLKKERKKRKPKAKNKKMWKQLKCQVCDLISLGSIAPLLPRWWAPKPPALGHGKEQTSTWGTGASPLSPSVRPGQIKSLPCGQAGGLRPLAPQIRNRSQTTLI
jgi:hypothetical protein